MKRMGGGGVFKMFTILYNPYSMVKWFTRWRGPAGDSVRVTGTCLMEDGGGAMINCAKCGGWFHWKCQGIRTRQELEEGGFTCTRGTGAREDGLLVGGTQECRLFDPGGKESEE